VGDQPRDIELAWEVGARSVLVLSGQTRHDAVEALERNGMAPHSIVEGLPEAVAWIVKDATTHQSVRTIADVER
jgi:ribonucleotide monophosphatase NagD (HAD superfamily)